MKVTLKRYQVRDLWNAIRLMDGRPEAVRDHDGKTLGILATPYDLDAKAVYALARTREAIRAEVAATDEAQAALARKGAADDGAMYRLLTEEVEVEVWRMPIASLKVGTNKIPPTVLADLLPVLEGEL